MSVSKEKLMHIANAVKLLQNTLKCAICLEVLRAPVSTRCGHHFCSLCVSNLLSHKKNGRVSCPLCSAIITRRGIVANDKIKGQVDGVVQLLKAIEADTAMDISSLRQIPSSTFEANSPVAGPSGSRNQTQKKGPVVEDVSLSRHEDLTPSKSPPHKLSSAEKVKTWLIQNDNDFDNKTTLNEFGNRKPSVCDEESDNEMISVSQVAPPSIISPCKKRNEPKKKIGRPAARRSLKIKEINVLTSNNVPKSSDGAFDRLLLDSRTTGSPKLKDKATASKGEENFIKHTPLSSEKRKSVHEGDTAPRSPIVLLELMEPQVLSASQSSKSDAPPSLQNKDNEEPFSPVKEMPRLEPVSNFKNNLLKSKKSSPTESQTSSCDIIPPSECAEDVPILSLKHTLKESSMVETKKKSSRLSNSIQLTAVKKAINQKVTDGSARRQSACLASGRTPSKASCSAVSKRYSVPFVKFGRVIRERRFLPVDIRCHCVDKPIFLVDFSDSSPRPHSVPPSPRKSLLVSEKELHSVSSQTSPRKSNPEPVTHTVKDIAMDTNAVDSGSEDMFPISPEKVKTGGAIDKRRSHNSSATSENFMDAATVVFSQRPTARSFNRDMDCTLLEPEQCVLKSQSESLLGNKNVVPEKKVIDSDEESVGGCIRKSTKRPRRLSSSGDSDDGREQIGRKKKKKKSPLSDSVRKSIDFLQEEIPVISSLFDQTLESPQRLVQGIKAKIAAGMLDQTADITRRNSPRASRASPRSSLQASKTSSRSSPQALRASPRSSPRASRASSASLPRYFPRSAEAERQTYKPTDDVTTPPQKKTASDSDISDCEILEGTPQQQTSINLSRRGLMSPERSFSGKAAKTLNTTLVPTESCTPGFIEPSQPPFDDLPPSLDSKKSEVQTSGEGSFGKNVPALEAVSSLVSKRSRSDKSPTPHKPLREKNTTEERPSNKTFNNISTLSTKEDRIPEKIKDATPRSAKKQTPKKVSQKLCFVCSGLAGNFTALVQKLAALVGADFSSKFDSKATHLVVKTKEDNTTDKTLKYLCAVAAKKWVVSFQWVIDSIKEGKLLPEEKFEALDTTGAEGPRLSRLSSKLLFSGFEFCIFPPLSDVTKEQLQELVEMCGATVVSDPKKFSFRSDMLPLCVAEYDEEREQDYAGWIDRYCVPLVQHEWILDCIGRFSLVSFWNLLMSDVSDDNLRSMGYPPHLIEHPPSDSTEMD